MKHPQAVLRMFTLSSVLTLFGYAWLVLPPAWTGTPSPAVAAFAIGIGFSPCESVLHYFIIIHSTCFSTPCGLGPSAGPVQVCINYSRCAQKRKSFIESSVLI